MDDLLFAHIIMGFSALFPAGLLELLNHGRTEDFIGYNTPMGQKSPETREFSVKYATRALLWVGLTTVTIQVICYFLIGGSTAVLITTCVMTFGFIGVVAMTERALHERFDKNGKPKELRPRF